MPTLHIMSGLPASGKSYFIKHNAKPSDIVLSRDIFRRDLRVSMGEESYFPLPYKEEVALFLDHIRDKIRQNHNQEDIWIDQTTLSQKTLKRTLSSLPLAGYEIIIHRITTPVLVCRARNADRPEFNNISQVISKVPDNHYIEMVETLNQRGIIPHENTSKKNPLPSYTILTHAIIFPTDESLIAAHFGPLNAEQPPAITSPVWLTADSHFGHDNIINYTNRPFTSEEQTEFLISKWNSRVREDDIVIHLGDFIMGNVSNIPQILPRLNGRIILIYGNHDTKKRIGEYRKFPEKIIDIRKDLTIAARGKTFYLTHSPNNAPEDLKHTLLHGHTHNADPFYDKYRNSFNLSVERTNYEPISIDYIVNKLEEE